MSVRRLSVVLSWTSPKEGATNDISGSCTNKRILQAPQISSCFQTYGTVFLFFLSGLMYLSLEIPDHGEAFA